MNTPTAEPPDLINLMEWNRFAEDRKTLLEALTILNNRHRTIVAELNQRLIERQESFQAQLVRIEDTWREKLREKDSQIAEASSIMAEFLREREDHRSALSTPPPPVVPRADVEPLLDALKIIAANPGAFHGPSCIYDSGPISRGAVGVFIAKHPATPSIGAPHTSP